MQYPLARSVNHSAGEAGEGGDLPRVQGADADRASFAARKGTIPAGAGSSGRMDEVQFPGPIAGATGIEPATSGFGDRRSGQLSYTPSIHRQHPTPTNPTPPNINNTPTRTGNRHRPPQRDTPDRDRPLPQCTEASTKGGGTIHAHAGNSAYVRDWRVRLTTERARQLLKIHFPTGAEVSSTLAAPRDALRFVFHAHRAPGVRVLCCPPRREADRTCGSAPQRSIGGNTIQARLLVRRDRAEARRSPGGHPARNRSCHHAGRRSVRDPQDEHRARILKALRPHRSPPVSG